MAGSVMFKWREFYNYERIFLHNFEANIFTY